MLGLRHQVRLKSYIRLFALAAFAGYCFWQVYWLIRGRLAPSLLTFYTSLPNPSSGVTRSIKAALAGHYQDFILYNPFTVPFIALLAYSLCRLLVSWVKNRELQLPPAVGKLWFALLACAWLVKFILGRKYW